MPHLLHWLYCLLGLLLLQACRPPAAQTTPEAQPAPPLTTLVLLRHAEQDLQAGEDPPLNARGSQRAKDLRLLLAHTAFDAIYATPYRRSMATAQPLAQAQGLTVQAYDPDQDLRQTAKQFLTQHPGQTLLVVGHSSTVPGLVNALVGDNRYPPLDKSAFGDIWVVAAGTAEQVSVVQWQMP